MRRPSRPFARGARLKSAFQQELATWLLRDADAPWNLATITRVDLTRDMSLLTVWVLLHESDDARADEAVAYLNEQVGHLRGMLGRAMRVKKVPDVRFRYDRPYAEAARVEGILAGLRASGDVEAAGEAES